MVDTVLFSVVVTTAIALFFDCSNGMHDAANAVSAVVGSKALTPYQAVVWAAIFNTLPAVAGGSAVANTVASIVDMDALTAVGPGEVPYGVRVACGALIAAIIFNLITLRGGIPSSSSHALIGGLLGAGLAAGGLDVITWTSVWKAAVAIVVSPLLAGLVAFILAFALKHLKRLTKIPDTHWSFRIGQIATCAALAWSHGSNDAQKTMGVISAALYASGHLTAASAKKLSPPLWVMLAAYFSIGLGTLFGGWKIIETVAMKLTNVGRAAGMAANLGAITAIESATALGIPISTTQAASASIAVSGLGAGFGMRLNTIWRMCVAWAFTIPASCGCGYVGFWIMMLPGNAAPSVILAVLACLMAWTAFILLKSTTPGDLRNQAEERLAANIASAASVSATAPPSGALASSSDVQVSFGGEGGAPGTPAKVANPYAEAVQTSAPVTVAFADGKDSEVTSSLAPAVASSWQWIQLSPMQGRSQSAAAPARAS
jgi:PiT family inorganic phosphate transporter